MKMLKTWMSVVILVSMTALGVACGGGSINLDDGYSPDDMGDGAYIDEGGANPFDDSFNDDGDGGGNGGGGGGNGDGNGNGNGGGGDGNDGPFDDMDGDGIPNDEDTDADGDGFFGVEDDCDDLDPDIYPGAPDKPDFPDYTDSNCDGVDGDKDFASWVSPKGNDQNPGTIDQPFLTLQKGIDTAKADLTDIRDVYVVEGVYNEDAYLLEGVGLYGGYGQLTPNLLRGRDIDLHSTRFDCLTMAFFVLATTTGQESVVEGFNFYAIPDQPALVVLNSSPKIQHNKIYGVDSSVLSYAVFVLSFNKPVVTKPVFLDNLIEGADGLKLSSVSVGILIAAAGKDAHVEPTLLKNDIRSGDTDYMSLGVYVVASQGAIASLRAIKKDVEAGSALSFTSGIFMGYDVFGEAQVSFADAEILQNRIHGGYDAAYTYGISLDSGTGSAEIVNNFITGGENSKLQCAGVHIQDSTANILNNTINAGYGANLAASVLLDQGAATEIDNNILFAEDSKTRVGVYEEVAWATPTSLRSNLFDDVLDVPYHDFNTGDVMNIQAVNSMPDIGLLGGNIDGDSAFVDLQGRDYHIAVDSDAVDAGMDIPQVQVDIEDDARPLGDFWDIGADELSFEGV